MRVSVSASLPDDELVVVALVYRKGHVDGRFSAVIEAAVERGEVRGRAGHVAQLTTSEGRRLLVIGGGDGDGDSLTAEQVRVAAAHATARAGAMAASRLVWVLPQTGGPGTAEATAAVVEGVLLRDWRYRAARREEPSGDETRLVELVVVGGDGAAAEAARVVAEAANWVRVQQHEPPNVLTPTELGRRAQAMATELANPNLEVKVDGTAFLEQQAMGALLAVSRGSSEEPALITARYRHPEATGPRIALVGKAVTFDSGGISIKPSARMHEMKFDMSGGAVVLGALKAVAELGLPLDLTVVVGATENLPSGDAYKPGDVITAADGTTIEITNTDAEGRMVLADCIWHARQEGAEVIVDVATLTGAVVVALGSTHAGLIATDDVLAAELLAAGDETGELAWRLPLHAEYGELMKSRDADLVNGSLERKAGTITGGYFLSRFAGDVAWAHLDIAGTAWDLGRPYAARGGAAYGMRLLVQWLKGRAGAA